MTNILYRQKYPFLVAFLLYWFLIFQPVKPVYIYIDNPNYVSCFTKNWFKDNQNTLLTLSNNKVTRNWFRRILRIENDCPKDKDIVKILPNCYTWRNSNGSYTTDFRTHNKFSKRLFYSFKPLWWVLHQWDIYIANNFCPQWNLGFDTLTVYPDANPETKTVDGYVAQNYGTSTGVSWNTLINAAGNVGAPSGSADVFVDIWFHNVDSQWRQLVRSIFLFDTSSLTSNAVIDSAIFSLRGYGKGDSSSISPNLNVFSSAPASNTNLVAGDYDSLGTTAFCDTAITYSGFSTSAYNNFTLNSTGISAISKTGISKFGVRNANYDVSGTAPTWTSTAEAYFQCFFAEYSGTANDPKLVVTYTIVEPSDFYSSRGVGRGISRGVGR
jgi:hypothetical protein